METATGHNRSSIHQFQLISELTKHLRLLSAGVLAMLLSSSAMAALVVPDVVKMPGSQPEDAVANIQLSSDCMSCHQSGTPTVTIGHDWRGSAMSHAGRDPLYWATVAIAEQVFDGAGDLCIRCHTMRGWQGGESTPTDASTLSEANAADGVGCDICHKMTNPDGSEYAGVQNAPFIANDGGTPPVGHYGAAQLALSGSTEKLGPYTDTAPWHPWNPSMFHRNVDFCGSCHDVSNPVVGDLAPNNGVQIPLPPGDAGTKFGGTTLEQKAAFNYFPYQYGVVERTYSEYKSSAFPTLPVSDYNTLPADLKDGSIQRTYDAALLAGKGGDYADGDTRYFSCQSCHMRPVEGLGANVPGAPARNDLPSHDLTGGNFWLSDLVQYMASQDTLLFGSGLSALETSGLVAGADRARDNLNKSASLDVAGNTLKIVNLTGHKLISGYPEGRRMWLNTTWKDGSGATLREDGAYGPLTVAFDVNDDGNVDGGDVVNTILDLNDPNTKFYEVHGAVSQEWADKLVNAAGFSAALPLTYNRVTGAVEKTLGDVATQSPGTALETFHFVLNNTVIKDNRIPPYGMRYDDAAERSILPVPDSQYGNPGAGGVYNYWDEFTLNPPVGAVTATINLMYQSTSWEYVSFLYLANNGAVLFLANEGTNLLDGWLNSGMSPPHVMASTTWSAGPDTDGDGVPDANDNCIEVANADQRDTDNDGYGNICDADFNNDGIVDASDLAYFRSRYRTTDPDANLNGNGIVDAGDLSIFRSLYMKPPGPGGLH